MSELTKKYIIDLQIIDDGTMDTVVYNSVNKKTYRYDSEFRFSFKDDEEFLKDIEEEILKDIEEEIYSTYEKLELVHWAIQEALHGNMNELSDALEIVEQLREPYLKKKVK